jgi:hypothetical protein
MATPISKLHARRLREIWRSAGWPCQDAVEVEQLDAGWLERLRDGAGRETLRLTDAGVAVLAQAVRGNRAARDAHEVLVERVATALQRAGRIVWRGLSLRAQVGADDAADAADARWATAMPDVYSIRHTTVEGYLVPMVHEIKVRRADLLADLRRGAKRDAYQQLCRQCWYVIREGIARSDEIPPDCGVIVATATALEVLRPAPDRALQLPFAVWMALARAAPMDNSALQDAQARLGDTLPPLPPAP